MLAFDLVSSRTKSHQKWVPNARSPQTKPATPVVTGANVVLVKTKKSGIKEKRIRKPKELLYKKEKLNKRAESKTFNHKIVSFSVYQARQATKKLLFIISSLAAGDDFVESRLQQNFTFMRLCMKRLPKGS